MSPSSGLKAKLSAQMMVCGIPANQRVVCHEGIHYIIVVIWLKGLSHGQKCLQLFSDSEAHCQQMGPTPKSNWT